MGRCGGPISADCDRPNLSALGIIHAVWQVRAGPRRSAGRVGRSDAEAERPNVRRSSSRRGRFDAGHERDSNVHSRRVWYAVAGAVGRPPTDGGRPLSATGKRIKQLLLRRVPRRRPPPAVSRKARRRAARTRRRQPALADAAERMRTTTTRPLASGVLFLLGSVSARFEIGAVRAYDSPSIDVWGARVRARRYGSRCVTPPALIQQLGPRNDNAESRRRLCVNELVER